MRPWNERSGHIWDGSSAIWLDRALVSVVRLARGTYRWLVRGGSSAAPRLDTVASGWLSPPEWPDTHQGGVSFRAGIEFHRSGHGEPGGMAVTCRRRGLSEP